jgi:hypothetical protein
LIRVGVSCQREEDDLKYSSRAVEAGDSYRASY